MLEITNHSCCFGIHVCYTIWVHEGAIPVPFVSTKKYDSMCVWPQRLTLCSPCSMGLDSANCLSFLKFFSSLKCCEWRYKFTSRSLQIRPCTRRMWSCLAFCHVNVALQYQQSKQGFSSPWAVFMCRVEQLSIPYHKSYMENAMGCSNVAVLHVVT